MLQKRIRQVLDLRYDVDQRQLARIAGVNESSISRYLNGFEEINFEAILKIVKHLFPEQEKEQIKELVPALKSRNARFALEYCIMNHLTEPCDYLIELLKASSNPVDKEWAALYQLFRLRQKKALPLKELLQQVEVFNPKTAEMQVLRTIFKVYIYFDMNAHQFLPWLTKDLEAQIDNMKSPLMQNSFRVRLSLIMSYVSLFANDVHQARYHSTFVIRQDFFEHVKGTAYHQLGHSYFFESYELASKYLRKAIEHYEKDQLKRLAYSSKILLSYLKSHWHKERIFSFKMNSYMERSEYIYHLIQTGDTEQAGKILQKIDEASTPDWAKGFHYFYLGLLHQDRDFFYHSVDWFKATGDYFHCQLPIRQLNQLNENKVVLKILSSNKEEFQYEKNNKELIYV